MKKIAVHSLLLLIILGSGRLQAVAGPADKIRKNIECYFNDYLRGETPLYEKHQSFSLLKASAYQANWYGKLGKQPTMSWTKKS